MQFLFSVFSVPALKHLSVSGVICVPGEYYITSMYKSKWKK